MTMRPVAGLVLVALGVVAVVASRSARGRTIVAVVGYSALFVLAVQVTWALLLFTNVVPVSSIARSVGVSDLALYPVVGWGIPTLATAVFAIVFSRRRRSRRHVAGLKGRSRSAT
jgi:hypothetical protein